MRNVMRENRCREGKRGVQRKKERYAADGEREWVTAADADADTNRKHKPGRQLHTNVST